MAEKLTPQQHQAVHNRGGTLLVSAAAGSGKTKVLVDRLLQYLTDPVNPANLDEFLIITYTKAAASELRGKIAAKLTERIAQTPDNIHLQKQMQRLYLTKISTVHGFCSDILREYAYKLDLAPDFRVADESECREIREQVMKDLLDRAYEEYGNDPDFLAFVDSQGLGRDDRFVPEILEKVYDSARCHIYSDKWLEDCLDSAVSGNEADIQNTPWAGYLISDLKEYLSAQIQIFDECRRLLDAADGMEKPAANIQSTLQQLRELQEAESWEQIVSLRNIDYGRLTFPRKNPDPELTDRVKAARNACKKGLERKMQAFSCDSQQILKDMQQTTASIRGLLVLVKRFERDYQAAKRSRNVLDFSDLEHKTLDLLLGKSREYPTAAASEIARRFREVLVDEYQDSNGVQDAIFTVLTREKHNCFLVGDVKQSIYQFRLADPGIFLEKYHLYLPAEEAQAGEGRKILLSHNFRSGPEVIECVNDVFATCMRPKVGGLHYGEGEALREGISRAPLPEPAVELYAVDVQEDTYREEAAFVADRIQQMLQDGTLIRKGEELCPVQPEDIVILLRSPGSAARYFQQALESRGIRCTTGAGMDLLKSEEISTLRALLQTVLNPRMDIPLLSVLASPVFGFTADDLAAIRSRKKAGSIYDALQLSETDNGKNFLEVLGQLRKIARMNTLTSLLENCFRLTKLDSIYASMPDGDRRGENLQSFYQLAADYENGTLKDLAQFLEYLNSIEDRGLVANSAGNPDCVTIMSIHKSKGLEFPVVFLSNLARQFNRESLRAQILCDKELGLGLSVADSALRIRYPSAAKRAIMVKMASDSVSEEMRVLYVAMTRARDRLIMTYAAKKLDADLQDIALRFDFDGGDLLCRSAVCPGDWVLMEAISRMEAGSLHALGGRPKNLHMSDYPWKICIGQATKAEAAQYVQESEGPTLPQGAVEKIGNALRFRYDHMAATIAPSKQTATGRKGRVKDAEAAEDTQEAPVKVRTFRRPSFLEQMQRGKEYGNAIHNAMQFIRYENCGSVDAVREEVSRLVEKGFLTEEQGSIVNCEKIARFFESPFGRQLRDGTPYIREFKFSILDDGSQYGKDLEGEQVLLQGVVDCALLEEDGITVVDFKTDHVTEETLAATAERYRLQVQTYGEALSRIYEKPIKGRFLYFFRLDRFVEV